MVTAAQRGTECLTFCLSDTNTTVAMGSDIAQGV